jgi:hypothetical protein
MRRSWTSTTRPGPGARSAGRFPSIRTSTVSASRVRWGSTPTRALSATASTTGTCAARRANSAAIRSRSALPSAASPTTTPSGRLQRVAAADEWLDDTTVRSATSRPSSRSSAPARASTNALRSVSDLHPWSATISLRCGFVTPRTTCMASFSRRMRSADTRSWSEGCSSRSRPRCARDSTSSSASSAIRVVTVRRSSATSTDSPKTSPGPYRAIVFSPSSTSTAPDATRYSASASSPAR